MFTKKNKSNNSDKKYYVLNPSLEIIPLENYKFNKTEIRLQSLADSECFFKKTKSKGKNSKDAIDGLGDFVEIEYCGKNEVEPKTITDEMIVFLRKLNVGKIHRNFVGYPFMMLFPNEVEFFEL